jgi:hypothetical protein
LALAVFDAENSCLDEVRERLVDVGVTPRQDVEQRLSWLR